MIAECERAQIEALDGQHVFDAVRVVCSAARGICVNIFARCVNDVISIADFFAFDVFNVHAVSKNNAQRRRCACVNIQLILRAVEGPCCALSADTVRRNVCNGSFAAVDIVADFCKIAAVNLRHGIYLSGCIRSVAHINRNAARVIGKGDVASVRVAYCG